MYEWFSYGCFRNIVSKKKFSTRICSNSLCLSLSLSLSEILCLLFFSDFRLFFVSLIFWGNFASPFSGTVIKKEGIFQKQYFCFRHQTRAVSREGRHQRREEPKRK